MKEKINVKKTLIIIALVVFVLAILAGIGTGIYFGVATIPCEGVVLDKDTGAPIANVSVSDGKNVVKTGADGKFKLKGWHKAKFVTITNPTGYWTEDYYKRIDRDTDEYKFVLEKQEQDYTEHSFIQVTDTEIGAGGAGPWLDNLKQEVKETNPAFLIHTGDICYEDGLKKHKSEMNSENMGVPVRYIIGNHDYVKYGSYGEQLFEEIYGPVYYSFDVGNIHYVVTPIVHGDYPARYSRSDAWRWLANDLAQVSGDKKVVIFNHDVCPDETGFELKYGTKKLDLKEKNLIAWVNGHLHYNFVNDYNGILNVSTASPIGGIDSSAGGFRIFDIENNAITRTYMKYTDYATEDTAEGYKWQSKYSGNGYFAEPIYQDGKVYIATSDNSYPRKPVVACVDAESGKTIWEYQPKNSVNNSMALYKGNLIFQDCEGRVYSLNASNKKENWIKDLNLLTYRYTNMGVYVYEDKVFCGGNGMTVHCLNASNGNEIWKYAYKDGVSSPYRMVAYDGKLIFGVGWREHIAIDINTGKKVWKGELGGLYANATPVFYKGNMIVSSNNSIIQINPSNGKLIKETKFENTTFNTASIPYIDGDVMYIATTNRGVVAIDLKTMKELWNVETGENKIYISPYSGKGVKGVEASIVEKDGKLYFGALDGYLYIVDKTNGEVLTKHNIGAPVVSKVAFDEKGSFYVLDFAGRLTKFAL